MVEQVVGLRFVVQGEREAKRALKEVSDNQSKLTRDILRGADQVKSLSREWDKANRYLQDGTIKTEAHRQVQIRLAREYALLNGYVKANGALNTQKALAEMRATQAAREAAAAAARRTAEEQRARQSYNQLLAAINPTIAAQQRMRQAHETVRAALAAGIITRQQAAQSLRQYRNALREATLAGNRAALGMNRLGLVTQQAGYQVGDFFVQIQSGTNVMVALGQQLTQLVGVFAMIARTTRMIAIFSGIGIIVPILTAIGAAYMRTKEAAEGAASGVKTLEDQMNSARASMAGLSDQIEIMNLGLQDTEELAFVRAISEAEKRVAAAEKALANAARARGGQDAPFAVPEKEKQLALARVALQAALDELEAYRRIRAEAESRNQLEEARLDSIRLYYDNLEKAANLEKENADAVTEIIKNRDAAVATLQEELILSQTILKYGKDSEQVAILKASNERAAFMEQAKQQGILGNNLAIVMALYDQNVKVSNEVEAASEKAKEFAEALKEASSAMASLSGFSANLDRELAVATAKVEALRQGADATIAGNIAGMRADLERRMGEAVAAGVDRGIVERQFGGERARISQLEALRQEEKRLGERGRGGAGGAGGAAQGDYLSQLQKEAELKLRLIGLTDEQRRYEEIAAELSERGLPVEEKRIQAIIATEQALQQATNAEERRQDIMQAVTGNIETALMGLVEGTSSVEDAFKSMMRNIILEVYRQQVAKPFADAIGSFFFANGAAFQGGNVVPFANGGVVGGPTTFPMSGGRTGLMGEAGPEAIMPLKRGKDGKLGVVAEGGGAVNITQNFNISANGDDSVKRIVQQQIPRIAEATKAAVVDAKRRGGAYGKAFA